MRKLAGQFDGSDWASPIPTPQGATPAGPNTQSVQTPQLPTPKIGPVAGTSGPNTTVGLGSAFSKGMGALNKGIGAAHQAVSNITPPPPDLDQVAQWKSQLDDPNTTYANGGKWEAANKLNKWMDQNKAHSQVQEMMKDPAVQQKLQMYNSPLGQVGQHVMPAIGSMTSDPTRFATLMNMPVLRDAFKSVVGPAGIPGLALAHGALSGNMGNWNALTAGLRDKQQRVPGRDFYGEVGGLLGQKKGSYDLVDTHLQRLKILREE